jgi:hypothetical protein
MLYTCTTVGDIADFHGAESILISGVKVYELRFSGLELQ